MMIRISYLLFLSQHCLTLGFFSVALINSLKSLFTTANLFASCDSDVLTSAPENIYKTCVIQYTTCESVLLDRYLTSMEVFMDL